MGSKLKPGAFDCYAKAEPDEEMFVLLARDELAPGLVCLWAALKSGHVPTAEAMFADLAQFAVTLPPERTHKVYEAMECSDRMIAWRRRRFGTETGAGSTAPSAANPTPRSESTDTASAAPAAE